MSSSYEGQLLMNFIMQCSLENVRRCCIDHPTWVNLMSPVEKIGPLHLAVYLRNPDIIQELLNCAADPNLQDNELNTPAHSAVKIGYLEGLKLLYSTGHCELKLLKNINGHSVLELSSIYPTSNELLNPKYHSFGDWNPYEWKLSKNKIIQGRKECKSFINRKIQEEYDQKRTQSNLDMIEYNSERQYKINIIRSTMTANDRRFTTQFDYIKHIEDRKDWNEDDIKFFHLHTEDIKAVTRELFSRDFARRVIRTGFNEASKKL
eukprot:gene8605-17756_t